MGESEKWRNFTHPYSFALTPGVVLFLPHIPVPEGMVVRAGGNCSFELRVSDLRERA
jgi:hypothetical protein